MQTITVRKKEYEVKKGDYILDNGSCLQFVTGNRRIIRTSGFDAFDYVELNKKAISEIDLSKLTKVENNGYVKYIFN